MSKSIGVFIPTYQAEHHLPRCLLPLIQSSLNPRILIIDSSSSDQTVTIAQAMGIETIIIPKEEFNHGRTREIGRKHLKTDIIVMMTQDAYLASPQMLEKLIHPLIEQKASIAYGRQLPYKEAGFFEAFPRHFNYPAQSHVRSIKDLDSFGSFTFFCSNSCAAYLNRALDEIGGFSDIIFGEDTIAAAKLLHNNHSIAYVAEAEVYHSHSYTLKEEFRRHFDMGMTRSKFQNLLLSRDGDKKRGKLYLKTLLKELWKNAPFLIPYACLQTLFKYGGYKLGSMTHAIYQK